MSKVELIHQCKKAFIWAKTYKERIFKMNGENKIKITREEIDKNLKSIPIEIDGEVVAIAVYNPNSLKTQKTVFSLIKELDKTEKAINKIDFTDEEKGLMENQLENSDEFKLASETINKLCNLAELNATGLENLQQKIDELFGESIFEVLTKYGEDGEYLYTLLKMAFEEIKKARNSKINEYLIK